MKAVLLLFVFSPVLPAADLSGAEPARYEADVTFTNTFDKDFTNLPVVLSVARVFGRGVDYAKFDRDGFHFYDAGGREVQFFYRQMPPHFSTATDEIVLVLPSLAKGATLQYRVANTLKRSEKQRPLDTDRLLDNANNLIPNPGFEKGADSWEGGRIVSDVVRSGKNSLLLQVPGKGGKAEAKCARPASFVKGKPYYFGIWAKSENVTRHAYRWDDAGGRISLTGNPLCLRVQKDHFRVMDDRNWYCYEASESDEPAHAPVPSMPVPCLAGGDSSLRITINQRDMPYLDPTKPARIWIDEILLFEQPEVSVSCERIRKQLAPDGFFLYRRAPTCISTPFGPIAPPRPYERIERIKDVAVQGERKCLTLGINTPRPIGALSLEISDLKGPNGAALGQDLREVEFSYVPVVDFKWTATSLEGWVIDGNPPRDIDRPGYVDYLIAYRIPPDASAGRYVGEVKVKSDGKVLAEVPVELEVVGYPLKVITERFIGEIYNDGCGPQRLGPGAELAGAVLPPRNADFYRYYSRCNYTMMMMFSHFLPFKEDEVDIPELLSRMKEMRDVAGCTAGVGLYWDASLDKHGRYGMWPRSGRKPEVYRAQVGKLDEALAEAKLPRLIYMIWDEPRYCDETTFGLLKGTGAYTTCDIFGMELLEALQKGVFTHPSVDDPSHEMGPALVKHARKLGVKLGFTGWPTRNFTRYQTGMMFASTGLSWWHHWYCNQFIAYHPHHKAFVRGHNIVGTGEGMIDLRYYDTLADAIALARKKNVARQEVEAAEKDMKEIFDYCTGDMYWLVGSQVGVCNGSPEDWGDDWFYDRWRAKMRKHTLAILRKVGKIQESDQRD